LEAALEAFVALNEFDEPHLGGWWAGLIIGLVVVVVVVVVVGVLLVLASRINAQARAAARELEAIRSTTNPLVELRRTNDTLQSILRGARTARQALGG
jgi:flagellar biosynthesis/type III secretory pathway M-ring protein FliF/YscJ